MADILITKIHNTLATYSMDIMPFLSGVVNHIKELENLDKMTLTSLLEQASDLTMLFQQDFEVNYITLLKFPPSPMDHQLTEFSQLFEMFLDFVRLTFTFTLDLGIDKDDYPFLRDLAHSMDDSRMQLAWYKLQKILALTQPHITRDSITQTETGDQGMNITGQPLDTQGFNSPIDSSIVIQAETNNSNTETVDQDMDINDQPLDTQDNDPTPPIDTPRDPIVYPDFELDFELDPELDVDIDFEPDDEFDFNMPQDIVPTETPTDSSETNDNRPLQVDNNNPRNNQNLNGQPDIDVEPNIVTDSDFDTDSDSDLDSDIEDIEGTFLTICEEIKKIIPPRKPIPLFSFG